MGFLTEEKKLKMLPRTTESMYGGELLKNIAGTVPAIPTAGVAELTPIQMLIQQSLPQLLQRTGEAGQLAMDQYKSTLEGGYDPRTSPYYEGFRQEAETLQNKGLTTLRQRAEKGGMLKSTPAIAQEADFLKQSNSVILQELGKLLERERDRTTQAAEGIQKAGAQEATNLAAVGGLAEAERTIEQQQADALYQQALMQIMFPYTYQADLASSLMNYSPGFYSTGGGLKAWAESMPMISSAIKGAATGASGGMSGVAGM